MTDITITVADIKPPFKPEGATGTVIDTEGKSWKVATRELAQFQRGHSYRILDIRTSEFGGRTYNFIQKFQTVVKTNGTSAPQTNGAAAPRSVSDGTRMDIFICGAFNNLMSNPCVNPLELQMMDIVEQLQKLKQAWLGVFGPSPLPKVGDPISTSPKRDNGDMNGEEIPY